MIQRHKNSFWKVFRIFWKLSDTQKTACLKMRNIWYSKSLFECHGVSCQSQTFFYYHVDQSEDWILLTRPFCFSSLPLLSEKRNAHIIVTMYSKPSAADCRGTNPGERELWNYCCELNITVTIHAIHTPLYRQWNSRRSNIRSRNRNIFDVTC